MGLASKAPALALSLLCSSAALAQPALTLTVPTATTATVASTAGDAQLDAKLRFLEERLDESVTHAKAWFWGWMSVFVVSAGVQGARLALVDSADADATAQRADLVITIVRSALALGNHLLRYRIKVRDGADPMRAISGDDRRAKLERLAMGESLLEDYAAESERRYSWIRHALSAAVNLAGFFILWLGYDDLTQGIINSAVGLVVGETIIWTQPWQPVSALEDYRSTFGKF